MNRFNSMCSATRGALNKKQETWKDKEIKIFKFLNPDITTLSAQTLYFFERYDDWWMTNWKWFGGIGGDLVEDCWLVRWLVHSCSSHLEHTASVKRFISLHFLNLTHSVGLFGRVISPSQGRYLTQTQNKHKQTSMPWVGFEPTIQRWSKRRQFMP
jgi:hypothetical protein